jgi:hypothetical protein
VERLPDEDGVYGLITGGDLLRRPGTGCDAGQPAAKPRSHLVVRFDSEHRLCGHSASQHRLGDLAGPCGEIEYSCPV